MANYNFESVSGSTITASNENDSIYFSSDIDSVSIDLGAGSDVLSIAGTANHDIRKRRIKQYRNRNSIRRKYYQSNQCCE